MSIRPSRNEEVLISFIKYCRDNPEQRFWQALRNWAGVGFVRLSNNLEEQGVDTYYWENKSN